MSLPKLYYRQNYTTVLTIQLFTKFELGQSSFLFG